MEKRKRCFLLIVFLGLMSSHGYSQVIEIRGDKEEYEKLQQELEQADSLREKIRLQKKYKEGIIERHLHEITEKEKVTSGETLQKVTEESSAKIIAHGVKGAFKYISSGGKNKAAARQTIIKQTTELTKIEIAEGEFYDYMDGKQLREITDKKNQAVSELNEINNRLTLLEEVVIPGTEAILAEKEVTLGEHLGELGQKVASVLVQCQNHRQDRTTRKYNCSTDVETEVVDTIVHVETDDEGNSYERIEYIYDRVFYCDCSQVSVCAQPSPNKYCSCPDRPLPNDRTPGRC